MIQNKAQTAVNGGPLFKGCNAVLNHLVHSLRARREQSARSVAPLGKDMPFPARRAERSDYSRLAESNNYVLMEYKNVSTNY